MNFEGQLERLRREEGLRNLEDIFDTASWETIREELGTRAPRIQLLAEGKLSSREQHAFEVIETFARDASKFYAEIFARALEEYRSERREIAPAIIEHIRKKSFDVPEFVIAHGELARELLREYGFDQDRLADGFLVNFQLPKPLSRFWWKEGETLWGPDPETNRSGIIEWGHLYRRLMPAIWAMQGFYENERNLEFIHLNDGGQHDPARYYYLWAVQERP